MRSQSMQQSFHLLPNQFERWNREKINAAVDVLPRSRVAISRRFAFYLMVAAVCVTGLGVAGILGALHIEKNAREYVTDALKKQFASDVKIGNLHLSLFPSVRASGGCAT